MSDLLTRLRENEPLRLVLWPVILGTVGLLVGHGVVDTDGASIITGIAVLILGGGGLETARSQVTPGAHIADAVARTAEQLRGPVADTLGEPGLTALDQVTAMVEAAVSQPPSTGRHAAE